jgi:NAD(P)-dependent dehydrogenase (short-subunit alcohol dehydrogenase family)
MVMVMGLQRKVVVVGSGSGIGAATTAHFHANGDYVHAVDIRPHATPASKTTPCDLRDPRQIDDLVAELGSGWDVLAYVAGLPGTFPAVDVLLVNYLGMRLTIEGMLPKMRPGGSMIIVASTAALGWEHRVAVLEGLLESREPEHVRRWQDAQAHSYPAYTSSKQAAILYAKRLAGTAQSKYGVRINMVSPGPVETPILSDFERSMGKDLLDNVRDAVGRHGAVGDIVPVIDFLGSDQARWVNGQDIQVDGGFISSMMIGPSIDLGSQPASAIPNRPG